MAKLLRKPQEIAVKTNAGGTPLSLFRNGTSERVTALYERWKVTDQWGGEHVERRCFRVRTSTGLVCDIYHEIGTKKWYLSKIHD
jgi:hypothetical protein